jgi:hypothetical protein
MYSIKFLILAVVISTQVSSGVVGGKFSVIFFTSEKFVFQVDANFIPFLEAHQKRIISLFNFSNTYLQSTRFDFHGTLLASADGSMGHFIELFGQLSAQETSTNQRLDQATNSTCIQNLRNILVNTISLSGFRIGTCSSQYYDEFVAASEPVYRRINEFQLASHTLPIFFMAEMQDENVLYDANAVMARIDARYAVKWDFLATQMPIFGQSIAPELGQTLRNLNAALASCFSDISNNFRTVAINVEERITTVCGQDES